MASRRDHQAADFNLQVSSCMAPRDRPANWRIQAIHTAVLHGRIWQGLALPQAVDAQQGAQRIGRVGDEPDRWRLTVISGA
ncbi:hypothetical protein BS642_05415 [Chromobacterium violaceum]|nr:hypothetical protein BS642_05415 [Chromobacterium violaceum]